MPSEKKSLANVTEEKLLNESYQENILGSIHLSHWCNWNNLKCFCSVWYMLLWRFKDTADRSPRIGYPSDFDFILADLVRALNDAKVLLLLTSQWIIDPYERPFDLCRHSICYIFTRFVRVYASWPPDSWVAHEGILMQLSYLTA